MIQLELNKQEQDILADILEYDHKQMRNEISNTENWEYKAGLKTREEVIKKVLAALRSVVH